MNFNKTYEKFSKLKFNCELSPKFSIIQLMSGASNNLVAHVKYKENNLILKILFNVARQNQIKKPEFNKLEIAFYIFFTQKYLLTDRTPHFIGIYLNKKCKDSIKVLQRFYPKSKDCPTLEQRLLSNENEYDLIELKICDLIKEINGKILLTTSNLILLEYAPMGLNDVISGYIYNIAKKPEKEKTTDILIQTLLRILFQICFTLAIVKNDYPGFFHGDLFMRNVLCIFENYRSNEYVAYYYKQKIFYLPASGIYAKINDFGESVIENEIEPGNYQYLKLQQKLLDIELSNQKADIFNLLYDMYEGQNENIGIKYYGKKYKVEEKYYKPIVNFIHMFINTVVIDDISKKNKSLLSSLWHIRNIDILNKAVVTPDQYLMLNVFNIFQTLPTDSVIIKHFNKDHNIV